MLTALSLMLMVLIVNSADARTWRVERDGSGDFTTIPAAIQASATGDTILIGAGRFTETVPFVFAPPDFTTEVHIPISVDSLTIIGSGVEETIIGPITPALTQDGPKGIVAPLGIDRLIVRNMTVENVRHGAFLSGRADLYNMRIRGCEIGAWEFTTGAVVESCEFLENTDGVSTGDGCSDLTIENCTFVDNGLGVGVNRTQNVVILSCSFMNSEWYTGGIQYSENCTGSVMGCLFDGSQGGVTIRSESDVSLERNQFRGHESALYVFDGSIARGSQNVFRGSFAAIRMATTSTAVLSGNHILKTGQWAVHSDYFTLHPVDIDLRNNYWGTDSADSISAWIFDGNDPQDPFYVENMSNVLYEPFSPVPVEAKETSVGGLKALFRRP